MKLLSTLFGHTVGLRNFLYDKKILSSFSSKAWVVSVGNITVGGTGKTPCVDFLLSLLEKKNHKVAVISRGYKSQKKGFNKVDKDHAHAGFLFGDEPSWLASRHPKVPVYISPDRVKGVLAIEKEFSPEIIIADDAFQHRRLLRDRDIVVIDATEEKENYRLLPMGRARESFDSLRRAHAIFLTKTNLVTSDVLRWVHGNIRFNKNIFNFEMIVDKIYNFSNVNLARDFSGQAVALVSGIGKPQNFEKILNRYKIERHLKYPDHARYDEHKVREILSLQEKMPVITTEKDYIKLKSYPVLEGKNIWVCGLQYRSQTDLETVYECIRPNHN